MTVRAEQDALSRLGPGSRQRTGHALTTKVELLQAGIQVMKLQRLLTAVISADQTSTSSLIHQLALDHLPPPGNPVQSTPLAAVVATPLADKAGLAVMLAPRNHLSRSIIRSALSPRSRLQFVLPHPVPDRRQTPVQPLSNLAQREAGGQQTFQVLL